MKGKIYKYLKYILAENPISKRLLEIPRINLIAWKIYSNFVKLYLKIMAKIKPERYDAEDPFKIHWVDPQKIEYKVKDNKPNIPFPGYGIKIDGEWDKNPEKIEDSQAYRKIRKILDPETESVLPEERVQELLKLKKSIEKEGYNTQKQLFKENPRETIQRSNDSSFPISNEIQICIGRSGEKYWTHQGKTRLIISKLTGKDRVPVLIQFKHKNFNP